MQKLVLITLLCSSTFAIASDETHPPTLDKLSFRFESITPEHSSIQFNNQITEDQVHNLFNFSYIYNGAGIAVGDINNDGLTDIYFTGNQVKNRLYLNQGGFKFKDITDSAFKQTDSGWKNGVTFIDINQDGLLDIYVCQSGLFQNEADRENRLYINQGDLTFKEEAKKYGLNDPGFSIQAYFFDYDRDNDLDLFLINHRYDFENNTLVTPREQIKYDPYSSDQLYQNNGDNTFSKVTQKSGIINYAWGLSAVINDFNNDGWDDIYVANDYVEPDNLYINNQDGTFSENIADYMKHISYYGMGSDLADVNNDGLQDLMVVDMVPEDHVRSKRLMAPMSTENFWRLIDSGLHYQFMLNTLQLNQGQGLYSEISQLAGVAKTDWSWAPLFADFDLDGYSDLFITNGIKRDITDNDFFNKLGKKQQASQQPLSFNQLIAEMPSSKLRNYLYHNQGNLTFKQANQAGNMLDFTHSNGAAYADFDNDGDLDLVVNNLDDTALLYQNNTTNPAQQHYLKIKLNGPKTNVNGIGATVSIKYNDHQQVKKLALSRGYLSSVEPLLHFGLGEIKQIDQLTVKWTDGKTTTLKNITSNKTLNVSYNTEALLSPETANQQTPIFSDISQQINIASQHRENDYNDFAKEVLLPHKQSEHGPFISVADVNGDQLDDFFVGGSAGYPGTLFLQMPDQTFVASPSQVWAKEAAAEDLGSLFIDYDNDGDQDLYVVSGGNEHTANNPLYQDRLYNNNGKGQFNKTTGILPTFTNSGMRVISADYDQDGDQDLMIGGRGVPGQYPLSPNSYLLKNEQGIFIDVTNSIAPELKNIGMVTDAVFVDYDNDNDLDLVLVGEWMPITLFENQQGKFKHITTASNLAQSKGWWFSLATADIDQDGDMDFIAGNIGLNNKYHPTAAKPLTVYANDFDKNGSLDIILAKNQNQRHLPIRGRQCSSTQIPSLLAKFPTFQSYAEADMNSIYQVSDLNNATTLEVKLFSHSMVINHGRKGFELKSLPIQTQISPITGLLIDDFNQDEKPDLLYTGNFYGAEVETVRYDAGIGGLLFNNGQTTELKPVSPLNSGFITHQNARDIKTIRLGKTHKQAVLVSNNNSKIQVFQLK